ncbi:conserved hypothetical protein [Ricinus communis]|uniref:Uncharacterized protein n=1 Tax=Ricinus communis TaxID=3988 RepID=B9T5I9_RICCO|nr:conserved hypothetical protein [Ricinus communis]
MNGCLDRIHLRYGLRLMGWTDIVVRELTNEEGSQWNEALIDAHFCPQDAMTLKQIPISKFQQDD